MTKGYIMSSTEFKETVETMVRDMPLADMLYINQSLIEAAITKWKEKDLETEMSPAQEDYKAYYVFLASVPDSITIIDPNLFIFKIARKIVDALCLSIIDSRYYENAFHDPDVSYEDTKFMSDVFKHVLDRTEESMKEDAANMDFEFNRNPDEMRKEMLESLDRKKHER